MSFDIIRVKNTEKENEYIKQSNYSPKTQELWNELFKRYNIIIASRQLGMSKITT